MKTAGQVGEEPGLGLRAEHNLDIASQTTTTSVDSPGSPAAKPGSLFNTY